MSSKDYKAVIRSSKKLQRVFRQFKMRVAAEHYIKQMRTIKAAFIGAIEQRKFEREVKATKLISKALRVHRNIDIWIYWDFNRIL